MEPTQIKRGSRAELVTAESSGSLPEAHQRAPTLMAGSEAGSGGKVQLWAPDTELVRKQAYRAGAAVSVYGLGTIVITCLTLQFVNGNLSPPLFVLSLVFFLIPWNFIGLYSMLTGPAIPAMRRKRYLTTDDAGIGITTWKASRYLAWEDVTMVQTAYPWGLRLFHRSGEKVEINLSGYPAAIRKELREQIVQKAGLVPLKGWYFLPGETYYALPGYHFSSTTGRLLPPVSTPVLAMPAGED